MKILNALLLAFLVCSIANLSFADNFLLAPPGITEEDEEEYLLQIEKIWATVDISSPYDDDSQKKLTEICRISKKIRVTTLLLLRYDEIYPILYSNVYSFVGEHEFTLTYILNMVEASRDFTNPKIMSNICNSSSFLEIFLVSCILNEKLTNESDDFSNLYQNFIELLNPYVDFENIPNERALLNNVIMKHNSGAIKLVSKRKFVRAGLRTANLINFLESLRFLFPSEHFEAELNNLKEFYDVLNRVTEQQQYIASSNNPLEVSL